MKKIDSLSIIINFDGYSQRAQKTTSKIESDVETAVRYAKIRGRYEKNSKKYAKNLGLRAMLYCGRPLKSQATEQTMRSFFLVDRSLAGLRPADVVEAGRRPAKERSTVGNQSAAKKYRLPFPGGTPAPLKGVLSAKIFRFLKISF